MIVCKVIYMYYLRLRCKRTGTPFRFFSHYDLIFFYFWYDYFYRLPVLHADFDMTFLILMSALSFR